MESIDKSTSCHLVHGLPRDKFYKLLKLATTEFVFLCLTITTTNRLMELQWGYRLAPLSYVNHERIWLDVCPEEFKPSYYRRYVDDIFVLFSSQCFIYFYSWIT